MQTSQCVRLRHISPRRAQHTMRWQRPPVQRWSTSAPLYSQSLDPKTTSTSARRSNQCLRHAKRTYGPANARRCCIKPDDGGCSASSKHNKVSTRKGSPRHDQTLCRALRPFGLFHAAETLADSFSLLFFRHADVIFVFANGNIAEMGTHEELQAMRGRYYEMCVAQSLDRA